MFIKGRNYFLNPKRQKLKKKIIKQTLSGVKRQINRRFVSSLHIRYRKANRKNIPCRSYFRRYLCSNTRRLYNRTIGLRGNHKFDYHAESDVFYNLRYKIYNYERKAMRNSRNNYYSNVRPLSKREFSFGKIYLTHGRRNSFITIHHLSLLEEQMTQRVVFKATCGLIGYLGPKRSTKHAREHLVKKAGTFLMKKQFTSVDIIFSSRVGRRFYPYIRKLLKTLIYVRQIIITKRRSHGFTRLKKAKRK